MQIMDLLNHLRNKYRIRGLSYGQPAAEYYRLGMKKYSTRSDKYPFGKGEPLMLLLCSTFKDDVRNRAQYKEMMARFNIENPREWCELLKRCVFAVGEVEKIIIIDQDFIDQQPETEIATGLWRVGYKAIQYKWFKYLDRAIDIEDQYQALFKISDFTLMKVISQVDESIMNQILEVNQAPQVVEQKRKSEYIPWLKRWKNERTGNI